MLRVQMLGERVSPSFEQRVDLLLRLGRHGGERFANPAVDGGDIDADSHREQAASPDRESPAHQIRPLVGGVGREQVSETGILGFQDGDDDTVALDMHAVGVPGCGQGVDGAHDRHAIGGV